MFTTFTKLNETLSAGVTYTVSADILLCRNTYYNGTETVDIPTDVALTFRMNLRTDLDGDDVEVAGSSVNIKCGETKAVTFNYTPATDKTGLLLCFNMSGSSWDYNGVSYCIDNVKITYQSASTEIEPENPDSGESNTTVPTTYTGYIVTGESTHAIIIGDAIITSNHEFDANGNCIYCGYHKDVVEEEVVVETPAESETEEIDEETTEENPVTGIALAIVPMTVAALAVVASKRR